MSDDIKKPTSEQMLVQNCARGLRNGVVKPDWADALLNYVRHLEIEAASCATLRVDRDIKAEHAALWEDACKQRDEENARLRAENERLTAQTVDMELEMSMHRVACESAARELQAADVDRSRLSSDLVAAKAENERQRIALHDAQAIGDFSSELRDRRGLQERADAADVLARRITELESELATARGDAERLDWLEEVVKVRCVSLDGSPACGLRENTDWHVHLNGIGPVGWTHSARESIDAARSLKTFASRSAPPTSSHGETTRMEKST